MPHIGEKIGISPLAEQHIDRAGQAYKGRAEEGRKERGTGKSGRRRTEDKAV